MTSAGHQRHHGQKYREQFSTGIKCYAGKQQMPPQDQATLSALQNEEAAIKALLTPDHWQSIQTSNRLKPLRLPKTVPRRI